MSDDAPLLKTIGLGCRIPPDGPWLFRAIDLKVQQGERLAVRGPTGSGKTVLLRTLAALDPQDEGQILWQGEAIDDSGIPKFRRQAIYLQQRPALFEGTVADNLQLPYFLNVYQNLQFDRSRAEGFLQQAGRESEFLTKPAQTLSGGEAQITALVRTLLLDPVLLFLDEPTAALDAETTTAIESLILNWQAEVSEKRTLVWVSHDPQQIERIATREYQLDNG